MRGEAGTRTEPGGISRACKISWYQIYKDFRGMRQAVRAAGLEPGPRGGPLDVNALVLDWARVVRELGRLPNRAEYSQRGNHHAGTLHARVGWAQMPHKFVLLVREFHMEREWSDVVEIVCRKYALLKMLGGDRVIGRSGDRVIGNADPELAADWRGEPQIGEEGNSRELTRMSANQNREPQRSIQQSALSIQSEESNWQLANSNWQRPFTAEDATDAKEEQRETYHGGTETRRTAEMERPDCLPLIRADNADQKACGMRLGRLVPAALAIEIMMATMTSGQAATPGYAETAESLGEGVNTSVAEAGIISTSTAGINACSSRVADGIVKWTG